MPGDSGHEDGVGKNWREKRREESVLRKAQEAARNFYGLGVEVEKVAEGVGYDLETVKKWLGLPV